MFDQKYIADWERIRRRFLNDPGKNIYVKGEECRKCVWSNTESGKILCTKSYQKERRKNMMTKYGMAEILESQAKIFIEKQFRDFDESAKERYLAVVLDYIHRNYPSSKEVA